MVGRRSQAQKLLPAGHRGVVDGLHVDVVPLQQGVAHLGVELGIAHLSNPSLEGEIKVIREERLCLFFPVEALYLDGDDVTGAVDHRQTLVHEQLPHVFDVSLVGSAQRLSLLALQHLDGLQ